MRRALLVASTALSLNFLGAPSFAYDPELQCQDLRPVPKSLDISRALFRIEVSVEPPLGESPVGQVSSVGTAFLIDKKRGLLLTALHVLQPERKNNPVKDCREIKVDADKISISTRVWGHSEPVKLDLVAALGCSDAALLEIDPQLVSEANVPNIAFTTAPPGEKLYAYNVISHSTPSESYEGVKKEAGFVYKSHDSGTYSQGWVPACSTEKCIWFSGFNVDNGHSGGPLLDGRGFVYGLISSRISNSSEDGWAIPISIIWEELKSEFPPLDSAQLQEIASWASDTSKHPNFGSRSKASTLELVMALEKFLSDPDKFGIAPHVSGCPIAIAAKHRELPPILYSSFYIRGYQREVSKSSSGTVSHASLRGKYREDAQKAFKQAAQQQANGDVDEASRLALVAARTYELAIAGYVNTDKGPGYISAIRENELGNVSLNTLVASDVATTLGASNWTPHVETERSNVFASLLREYAEAQSLVAQTNLTSSNDVSRTLASAAAGWAARVAASDQERAKAYQTYGSALAAAGRPDDALTAYARALQLQESLGHENDKSIARFVEASELAKKEVVTNAVGKARGKSLTYAIGVVIGPIARESIVPNSVQIRGAIKSLPANNVALGFSPELR